MNLVSVKTTANCLVSYLNTDMTKRKNFFLLQESMYGIKIPYVWVSKNSLPSYCTSWKKLELTTSVGKATRSLYAKPYKLL
jgi:hypothetical protein